MYPVELSLPRSSTGELKPSGVEKLGCTCNVLQDFDLEVAVWQTS